MRRAWGFVNTWCIIHYHAHCRARCGAVLSIISPARCWPATSVLTQLLPAPRSGLSCAALQAAGVATAAACGGGLLPWRRLEQALPEGQQRPRRRVSASGGKSLLPMALHLLYC